MRKKQSLIRLPGRAGFTLIEVLLAVTLTAIVFGSTMYFFRMGNQSIIKISDHAQARMNAIKILNYIVDDLKRCVVDDSMARLIQPVEIYEGNSKSLTGSGDKIVFYGIHHRRFAPPKMQLVAQRIEYGTEPLPGDPDAFIVTRNGVRLGGAGLGHVDPVSRLRFDAMDIKQACQMRISPYHAITVRVFPRGNMDTKSWTKGAAAGLKFGEGDSTAERNVQQRLCRLSNIESQFACMLSIKNSIKNSVPAQLAYPDIALLDAPFGMNCPEIKQTVSHPMDWVRPPNLVLIDDVPFNDQTANIDVNG